MPRVIVLLGLMASFADAVGPSFQALMDPKVFPEPQRGMRVEEAATEGPILSITTTGSVLTLDSSHGTVSFHQRIGHPRTVVTLQIGDGPLDRPKVTHKSEGLAFVEFSRPRIDIRANGDSLYLFHAREPMRITVRRAIEAGFSSSYKSNHILLDEYGGFGLYCSRQDSDDGFDAYAPTTATYNLPADAVLCVGICPPKPFDWEQSFKDHVVWHWSNQLAYPPDDSLIAWAKEGNIFLLQSEVMLWKDWNKAFEPRLGEAEFARVRDTAHRHGSRFIVYTSPYYFLKGTALEPNALNSFKNFKGWPVGTPTGENIDLFTAEITKLIKTQRPDGLYFDGQYTENPAALYTLARRTRGLLGEDGILEWHSSNALGPDLCFLPQADAYVDFILRGEGRERLYTDERYLRYFVSGYNTSNSIGVLCNNGSQPTAELIGTLLAVNGRMHTIASWLADPKLAELIHTNYRAKLRPALREEVERGVEQRQAKIPALARVIAAEHAALATRPAWDEPVLVERFDAPLPEAIWKPSVSPLNKNPFATQAGGLVITAHASTYAYYTHPLGSRINGMIVQLRQDTDGGQAWGPGVCVRWKSGAMLRVGVRSDGLVQTDFSGADQRVGGSYRRGQTIWLRVRWLAHSGVIEASDDGRTWRCLWGFEPGTAMAGPAESVSVGKVPYNGQPIDYAADPGAVGTCAIEQLRLY